MINTTPYKDEANDPREAEPEACVCVFIYRRESIHFDARCPHVDPGKSPCS
jgi:hypothetical protein